MSLSQKHKVDSESRIFQTKETEEHFCISMNGKALCLICNESMAALQEYKITRHHSSKHKNCVGALRREQVASLKSDLKHKIISSDSSFAMRASCSLVH
jgi:hypothetical protein